MERVSHKGEPCGAWSFLQMFNHRLLRISSYVLWFKVGVDELVVLVWATPEFTQFPSHDNTRLEQEQILGLFELCPNLPKKIRAKLVLNSIWLIYGSSVIRLQRLQTATCKNMLVSILHNILTPLIVTGKQIGRAHV